MKCLVYFGITSTKEDTFALLSSRGKLGQKAARTLLKIGFSFVFRTLLHTIGIVVFETRLDA